jgi:hypothetical protein
MIKKPSNDIARISKYFMQYYKKRVEEIRSPVKIIEQLVAEHPQMTGEDVINSISWGRIKELIGKDPEKCGVCESELIIIPIKDGKINIRCSNDDCETGIETVDMNDVK